MSESDQLDGRGDGPRPPAVPDPEVRPRAHYRHFTTEYKRQILEAAAACTEPGQLGALLRREGLYHAHLKKWREQQASGAWDRPEITKPGPAPNPQAQELARLQRENQQLQERLRKAELIIEVQKKVSSLLGLDVEPPEDPKS